MKHLVILVGLAFLVACGGGGGGGSDSASTQTTETTPPVSRYPDVEGIYKTRYAETTQRCDWNLTQEYIRWCVLYCAPGPIKTSGTQYKTISAVSRDVTVFQNDRDIWTSNGFADFSGYVNPGGSFVMTDEERGTSWRKDGVFSAGGWSGTMSAKWADNSNWQIVYNCSISGPFSGQKG